MRKILLICVSMMMLLGLGACDPAQSAVKDLESLVNDIKTNSQSYTAEDWAEVEASYSEIETELAKYEYSDADLEKIGELKGKYIGYKTKQSIEDFGKQLKDSAKELEGGIQGFLDAISDDGTEEK